MKAYPLSLRSKIVNAYKNNEGSMLKLACKYGVSRSFVQKIIKQDKVKGHLKPLDNGSKIAKLSAYQSTIKQILSQKPKATLNDLCQSLAEETGIEVSRSTMCRFLKQLNREVA